MNSTDSRHFVHDNELYTHNRIGISFREGKKQEKTVNEEELLISCNLRKSSRVFVVVFGDIMFFLIYIYYL